MVGLLWMGGDLDKISSVLFFRWLCEILVHSHLLQYRNFSGSAACTDSARSNINR